MHVTTAHLCFTLFENAHFGIAVLAAVVNLVGGGAAEITRILALTLGGVPNRNGADEFEFESGSGNEGWSSKLHSG